MLSLIYDIFLSYSTKDRERLRPLFNALSQQGWSVFWDHESIHTGENWHHKINEAIKNSRSVVVVWSQYSIESEWVLEEAYKGKSRKVLLPIKIDAIDPPFGFSFQQTSNFTRWNGKTNHPPFPELIKRIHELLGNSNVLPPQVSQSIPFHHNIFLLIAIIIIGATVTTWLLQLPNKQEIKANPIKDSNRNTESKPASSDTKEKLDNHKLIIKTKPEHAIIMVNGHPYDPKKTWEVGSYTVKVSADRYKPVVRIVTMQNQSTEVSIELTPERSSFEPEMLEIPSNNFIVDCKGNNNYNETICSANEKAVIEVQVNKFRLSKTEITISQFRDFIKDTGYKTTAEQSDSCFGNNNQDNSWEWVESRTWEKPGFSQDENSPVVCVSWLDAQSYIKWLNKKTGKIYRLPSEIEWEYAASDEQKSLYYWGNSILGSCQFSNIADLKLKSKFPKLNTIKCNDGYVYTAPVSKYKANKYGLYDMIGNVWEWCSGYSNKYSYNGLNISNDVVNNIHAIRGGSWIDDEFNTSLRSVREYDMRSNFIGFRIASDI